MYEVKPTSASCLSFSSLDLLSQVLAKCYFHGVGQEKNLKSAFLWFSKSAASGHVCPSVSDVPSPCYHAQRESCFELGNMWLRGQGSPQQDAKKAAAWLKKAANEGDATTAEG